MATREQLEEGIRRAAAADDGDAVRALGAELRRMQRQAPEATAQQPMPQQAPAEAMAGAGISFSDPPQPTPAPTPDLPSSIQGSGRGLADLALGAVDLSNVIANLPIAGVDSLAQAFGLGEVPFRFDPNVSQRLADVSSSGFESATEAIGYPVNVRDPSEMGVLEQGTYNAGRFATGALGVSKGLSMAARAGDAAASRLPTVGDAFLDPYRGGSAGRVVAGDTAAGAGAGVGFTGSQQLPEETRDMGGGTVGVAADLGAMLLGAGAAQGLASTVTGGPAFIVDNIRGRLTDRGVTRDPTTGKPVNRRTADEAARLIQEQTTDPRQAAQNIKDASALARAAGEPVPTAGLVSGDTGLEALERGQRVRQGATTVANNPDPNVRKDYSFTERDNRLREAASAKVQGLRDPNADPDIARRFAEGEAISRRAAADEGVTTQESALSAARLAEEQVGAPVAPLADDAAQVNASQRLDRAIVDDAYIPLRGEKNERFRAAIEPIAGNRIDAAEPIRAAERVLGKVNGLAGAQRDAFSSELIESLTALSPRMQTQASRVLGPDGVPLSREVNVGGDGTARVGDLAGVRGQLKEAEATARRAPSNPGLADDIRELRNAVNRTLDEIPELAEANRFYREDFATVFKPAVGDTMDTFARKLDAQPNVDGRIARGPGTEASATARTFTATPESRTSLKRVLDASPSRAAGMKAVDDYMTSKFAVQALNPSADGSIRLNRAQSWMRANAAALDDFPSTKARLQKMVDDATSTGETSARVSAELKAAQKRVKATEDDINQGAVGALLGREPQEAASRILRGEDATRRMRETVKLLENDEAALSGWKAAVADSILDRVMKDIDRSELSYAQIRDVWKKNEKTLAEVYSPDEMQALRTSQRIMEPLLKREGARSTVGSPTSENMFTNESFWRKMRTTLYVTPGTKYQGNALSVGGVVGRMRDMVLDVAGTSAQTKAVQSILVRWNFDPETAVSLVGRDLGAVGSPKYNDALGKTLRRAMAIRESGQDDEAAGEGEPRGDLEMTVTPGRN